MSIRHDSRTVYVTRLSTCWLSVQDSPWFLAGPARIETDGTATTLFLHEPAATAQPVRITLLPGQWRLFYDTLAIGTHCDCNRELPQCPACGSRLQANEADMAPDGRLMHAECIERWAAETRLQEQRDAADRDGLFDAP